MIEIEEYLAAIQARADAATAGPWFAVDSNDDHTNPMWQVYDEVFIRPFGHPDDTPYMSALIENSETGSADAEFIAHAREDIPALLVEFAALRKQMEARDAVLTSYRGMARWPDWRPLFSDYEAAKAATNE